MCYEYHLIKGVNLEENSTYVFVWLILLQFWVDNVAYWRTNQFYFYIVIAPFINQILFHDCNKLLRLNLPNEHNKIISVIIVAP